MLVKHENGKSYVKTLFTEAEVGAEAARPDGMIPLSDDGEWIAVPSAVVPFQVTPEMREAAPVPAYGSLQGIIHSLQKEASRPYFQLRELATDALVRCFYSASQYDQVVASLKQKTAVLHVTGGIKYDRRSRSAVELAVEQINEAKILSPAEYETLFGSMPKFTGNLSTDEYLDFERGDG